jgi:hypothetical protein
VRGPCNALYGLQLTRPPKVPPFGHVNADHARKLPVEAVREADRASARHDQFVWKALAVLRSHPRASANA